MDGHLPPKVSVSPRTDRIVTMRDVARAAAVSPATVSRVLNGHVTRPALDLAVREAVAQLGYRPNLIARGLRKQVANVWALVISDIENQFFTAVMRGVEDIARSVDAPVVLCNTDDDVGKETEYLRMIAAQRMAGVILSPASRSRTDISVLEAAGVHVVLIDRELDEQRDTVMVNSVAGAERATTHLIERGCRRIACITGGRETSTGQKRLEGYRRALRAANIPVTPEIEVCCDFKQPLALAAARELIGLPRPPDGFFAGNNEMTLGVLRAAAEAGLRVPEDAGVAGFDDMPSWSIFRPTVTVIAQPTYEMGRTAGQMLADRLRGGAVEPQVSMFEPQLIERESSQLGMTLGPGALLYRPAANPTHPRTDPDQRRD